jgi:hypothetical protein
VERLDLQDQYGYSNFCELADRWGITDGLAYRLMRSAQELSFISHRSAFIISGFRSRAQQIELKRRGRPAADPDRSTHTTCPATGADIWLGPNPPAGLIMRWWQIVGLNGLRLGGGSPLNDDKVPSDWPHVDLGPRGSRPIDWREPPFEPTMPRPPGVPPVYGVAPAHNKIERQQIARQQVRTIKHAIDHTMGVDNFGP